MRSEPLPLAWSLLDDACVARPPSSPLRPALLQPPTPIRQSHPCLAAPELPAVYAVPASIASRPVLERTPNGLIPAKSVNRLSLPARIPAGLYIWYKLPRASRPLAPLAGRHRRGRHPVRAARTLRNSSFQLPSSFRASAGSPRHIPQKFQFRQQQCPAPMQPRTNRSDRAPARLRCFLVTQLFQFAKHYGFSKFRR